MLRQAFEHFDKDKSGEIDKAELQAVFAGRYNEKFALATIS